MLNLRYIDTMRYFAEIRFLMGYKTPMKSIAALLSLLLVSVSQLAHAEESVPCLNVNRFLSGFMTAAEIRRSIVDLHVISDGTPVSEKYIAALLEREGQSSGAIFSGPELVALQSTPEYRAEYQRPTFKYFNGCEGIAFRGSRDHGPYLQIVEASPTHLLTELRTHAPLPPPDDRLVPKNADGIYSSF